MANKESLSNLENCIYADLFYKIIINGGKENQIEIISPELEDCVPQEGMIKEEIYQTITPEGTVLEFNSAGYKEGDVVIVKDPTSKKDYTVVF